MGPNGGYIAAILLNGVKQLFPDLPTRSFTCHFISASVLGPATVEVNLEKAGRTLSTGTATLKQNGKTITFTLVTLSATRDPLVAMEDLQPPMPEPGLIPLEARMNSSMPVYSRFRAKYDQRIGLGAIPPKIDKDARTGGWARFREPRPYDDLALVAISDSWFPSIFSARDASIHTPTVDHTVHFMHPVDSVPADSFVAVLFETTSTAAGFLIEDASLHDESWDETGKQLARSQQLAIVLAGDRY